MGVCAHSSTVPQDWFKQKCTSGVRPSFKEVPGNQTKQSFLFLISLITDTAFVLHAFLSVPFLFPAEQQFSFSLHAVFQAGFYVVTVLPKHSCCISLFAVNTTPLVDASLYQSPQIVKCFAVGISRAGSRQWWEEALSFSCQIGCHLSCFVLVSVQQIVKDFSICLHDNDLAKADL